MERTYVRADVIEPVIWHAIVQMITDPQVILDTIDADYDEKLAEYRGQLAYIEQSLDQVKAEWKRWNSAYGSGVIDLDELKKRQSEITRRRKELEVDRDELTGRIERIESIEDRKAYTREILGLYREVVKKAGEDPPLELRRQLLEMLVDTVWVNDQTMMDRIDGVIPSAVDIMETSFELQLTRKRQRYPYPGNFPSSPHTRPTKFEANVRTLLTGNQDYAIIILETETMVSLYETRNQPILSA